MGICFISRKIRKVHWICYFNVKAGMYCSAYASQNPGPGKRKIYEIIPCVVSYEGVPIVNFVQFVQKFHLLWSLI